MKIHNNISPLKFSLLIILLVIIPTTLLASQPAGISLNQNSTSTISWIFNPGIWNVSTSSSLHTGDDTYAQDWTKSGGDTDGQAVYAAISGVVAKSYLSQTCYGNTIVIFDQASGFAVRYAHLKDRSVVEGTNVIAGETLIGHIGNTGPGGTSCNISSMSSHLHLVLYKSATSSSARPISQISLTDATYAASFNFTGTRISTKTSWDFNTATDTEGWEPTNYESYSVNNGSFFLNPLASDPYVSGPTIAANASNYNTILMLMASNAPDSFGNIFFKTAIEDNYAEDKKVSFNVTNEPGGSAHWYTYSIYMGGHQKWSGTITGIRVDPANTGIVGTGTDTIGFDYIRLSYTSPSDTTPDQFTFTDQTGAELNTTATSNAITVSGINAAASISITGGTYSIN
ncbi:MAG: M23 family metallopeptidase, partial [Syntrophaceae bacterium]|nr:M23 family metallopeptidase [Syntrophaceae bacterium]